jgi:hypothetical protein
MQSLLGAAYKWLVDTLNKVSTTQTQTNSALQVVGMTVTNNSPSGGQISWSACTVYYNGAAYPIAAGSAGTNQFVWWVVGAAAFSSGNTFTPGPTVFPVLTNVQGSGDLAWNKIGSAAVTASHLNVGQVLIGPKGILDLTNISYTSTPGTKVSWTAGQATYKNVIYNVTAGDTSSSGTGGWIYWQLSNPTVLQISANPPVLGADDFVVGFDTFSGNPSQRGYFTPAYEVHIASGSRCYIADSGINEYNAAGNPTFTLRRSATDGGGTNAHGSLFLFDGSGTTGVNSNGDLGDLQLHNTDGLPLKLSNMTIAGASGASAGFITIQVNGTTYKLQIFNP